jgi:hypothetical protein
MNTLLSCGVDVSHVCKSTHLDVDVKHFIQNEKRLPVGSLLIYGSNALGPTPSIAPGASQDLRLLAQAAN